MLLPTAGGSAAAPFVLDTFVAANGTELSLHTGEIGATWTAHPASTGTLSIQTDRVYHSGAQFTFPRYYTSGVPGSANYDVTAIIRVVSNADSVAGIAARMDTSATTYYTVEYDNYHGDAPAAWLLAKVVAGATTVLGSFVQTITVGQDYTVVLKCRDSLKEMYIDGVQRASSADNAIAAAGRVGIIIYSDVAGDPSIGYHVASITGQV